MYTESGVVNYRAVYTPAFRRQADAARKARKRQEQAEARAKRDAEFAAEVELVKVRQKHIEADPKIGTSKEYWDRKRKEAAAKAEKIAPVYNEPPARKWTYAEIERRFCAVGWKTPTGTRVPYSHRDIAGQCRHRELALIRQAIMYWTARLTGMSYPAIGRLMKKDHTTVLYGKDSYIAKRAKQGRTLREVR